MSLSQCVECGALYQTVLCDKFHCGKCKVCKYFFNPISSLVESDDFMSLTEVDK